MFCSCSGLIQNKLFVITLFTHFLIKAIFKLISIVSHKSKLIELKHNLLDDEKYHDGEDSEIEIKHRRFTRIMLFCLYPYIVLTGYIILLYPFFSSDEYLMPIYVQLPWTKYVNQLTEHLHIYL